MIAVAYYRAKQRAAESLEESLESARVEPLRLSCGGQ